MKQLSDLAPKGRVVLPAATWDFRNYDLNSVAPKGRVDYLRRLGTSTFFSFENKTSYDVAPKGWIKMMSRCFLESILE